MTLRKITTPAVPEPAGGIYTNCFVLDGQVFMSGQVATGDGMEAQARAVFTRIKNLLEAAGGGLSDVVKMTVYVTDMGKRAEFGKVRAEFFPGDKPCSTLVQVSALANPDYLVEVDVTAVLGAGRR
ncbi:MAG TPA: RidA family protein [Burkholderiales bacterium]|jgi:2-iminobutanoate/2-iminopropanoate deaminase|nr:RidA family protein [Burkholderiales bacterium]